MHGLVNRATTRCLRGPSTLDRASGAVLWNDKAKFDAWGAHVKATAARLNIGIRWGGDFSFYDGAHFELEDQS